MIEKKEKPRSLIETFKERIKHMEANDPHNETLEPLKHHMSEHVWKIIPS